MKNIIKWAGLFLLPAMLLAFLGVPTLRAAGIHIDPTAFSVVGATLAANVHTLADVVKRQDPNGKHADIVEILNQRNAIIEDMKFMEGNLPIGHQATIRTGLPAVTWRLLNQGVPPTKSTTAQTVFQAARMENWVEIDEAILEIQRDPAAYRQGEVAAHVEAMSQEFAQTLFYGNATTAPEEFTGLSNYYTSLSAANGQNIISAGGVGSDNASIWLINWGPGLYGLYPMGTKAGLEHIDHGKGIIESTAGVAGNRLVGYRDQLVWRCGVAVVDWRDAVRIANIDISNLVADTAGASVKLIEYMARAIDRISPTGAANRLAFYVNRTVASILRVQAMNKSANALGVEQGLDQFGRNRPGGTLTFLGIPVRVVDSLLESEAVVS